MVLCLGPDLASLREQLLMALSQGNAVIAVAAGAAQLADSLPEGFAVKGIDGSLDDVALIGCEGFAAVASQAEPAKPCRLTVRRWLSAAVRYCRC